MFVTMDGLGGSFNNEPTAASGHSNLTLADYDEALLEAVDQSDTARVWSLLGKGADPRVRGCFERAASLADDDVSILLLGAMRAKPQEDDYAVWGQLFLDYVLENRYELVKEVYNMAPEEANVVNFQDPKTGNTALHLAYQTDQSDDTQKFLRQWRIKTYLRNKKGQTAIEYADEQLCQNFSIEDYDEDKSYQPTDTSGQAQKIGVRWRKQGLGLVRGNDNYTRPMISVQGPDERNRQPPAVFVKVFGPDDTGPKTRYDPGHLVRVRKLQQNIRREHNILQKIMHPYIVEYLGFKKSGDPPEATLYLEYCNDGSLSRYYRQGYSNDQITTSTRTDFSLWNSSHGSVATLTSFLSAAPLINSTLPNHNQSDPSQNSGPNLTEGEIWRFLFQTACAVAYLHHGFGINSPYESDNVFATTWDRVLHRDIKPANVVLHRHVNGSRTAKLCDLGLAVDQDARTRAIGTPSFLPPEVCRDGPWSTKGDIFSLGLTFIRILPDDIDTFGSGAKIQALLNRCVEDDAARRPSSLTILEICSPHVQDHVDTRLLAGYFKDELEACTSSNYVLSAFLVLAKSVDDGDSWTLRSTRARRAGLLRRLRTLYEEDGAMASFGVERAELHLAVMLNDVVKVGWLLKHPGVRPTVNRGWHKSHWTPLHLACQGRECNERHRIEQMLRSAGAQELEDRNGLTPRQCKLYPPMEPNERRQRRRLDRERSNL